MGRSKKHINEKLVIPKEQVWKAKKPRYNGFACGYGIHGKTKYDRNRDKQILRDELKNW